MSKSKSIHGMSSEAAREKKLFGHAHEYIIASKIGGQILCGRGKGDVINTDGELLSVKTGKKTQWGLYCKNTVLNGMWSDSQRKSLINYIDFLPDSKVDYELNKLKYKQNTYVKELYFEFMNDYMSLIKFFCGYGKVDFFHLTDIRDGKQYQISSDYFFKRIGESISRVYYTLGGKFVIAGGNKDIILFELELRKGTNHKKMLFHSHLSRIIDIVK